MIKHSDNKILEQIGQSVFIIIIFFFYISKLLDHIGENIGDLGLVMTFYLFYFFPFIFISCRVITLQYCKHSSWDFPGYIIQAADSQSASEIYINEDFLTPTPGLTESESLRSGAGKSVFKPLLG